jgi:hypothetical protein
MVEDIEFDDDVMVDPTDNLEDINSGILNSEESVNEEEEKGAKEKKIKGKYMDINEAHYIMGHLGETALRSILNHHGIKAAGTFKNCIGCMKWKGGNKKVSKVDVNPAENLGERLHVDASGPLPLPQGSQEYWLKNQRYI